MQFCPFDLLLAPSFDDELGEDCRSVSKSKLVLAVQKNNYDCLPQRYRIPASSLTSLDHDVSSKFPR